MLNKLVTHQIRLRCEVSLMEIDFGGSSHFGGREDTSVTRIVTVTRPASDGSPLSLATATISYCRGEAGRESCKTSKSECSHLKWFLDSNNYLRAAGAEIIALF